MLALPAVTQPIGAGPSSVVLIATWALLTVEALLLVDVNLAVRYGFVWFMLVNCGCPPCTSNACVRHCLCYRANAWLQREGDTCSGSVAALCSTPVPLPGANLCQ